MKPGVTVDAVQQELMRVRQDVTAEAGGKSDGRDYLRADPIQANLFSRFKQYLWLVELAAGLVLFMACTNLAILLVMRGRSRESLAAISTALGASRARVLSTAMLESVVICLSGCALALVAVAATGAAVAMVLPPLFSRYATGVVDARVLGFSLAVACVAAVVAGTWPAWRMTRVGASVSLQKTAGRTGGRASRGIRSLMAIEAALGCVLVLGSVLAVRSFDRLADDPLGFQPAGLSLVEIGGGGRLPYAEQRARMDAVLEAVRRVPGVSSAAAADRMPMTGLVGGVRQFTSGGLTGSKIQVSDGYFATMGTPVVAGRDFTGAEPTGAVAILNHAAATLLFPQTAPAAVVGRTFHADGEAPREIVGVVQPFKDGYGGRAGGAVVFVPAAAEGSEWGGLMVRATEGRAVTAEGLRSAIRARIGEVPVRTTYVPDALEPSLRDARFRAVLLTVLALAGLGLAIVGMYAIASYDVALRVHEMGVRLTLGATPAGLQRRILGQACLPVLAGVMAGLIGAYWTTQFATTFLFNMTGRDPVTYVTVAAVMVITPLVASWLPARRAAATDPAVVLKVQ
jgi:predicted permease